jgi:hypothetical protein
MADNTTVFNEILEIGIDSQKFADDMDRILKIYSDKIKQMPHIGDLGATELADSIKKIDTTLEKLGKDAGDVLTGIAKASTDSLSSLEAQIAALGKQVSGALGQINTAQTAGTQATQEAEQASGSFFTSFESGMLGSIAHVAKFYVLWSLVSHTFELLGSIIKAPFQAIGEGFTFLRDFQERSEQLQAVLLQSVQFSHNFAENIHIAAQESERLTRQIDELAIKLNTSSQVIQTALQTFLSFGGRNLTNSLNESLNVASLVAAALQATNPQIQSRKLQTEIQQLITGNIAASSRLAAALGLSNEQLAQIVVHAKQYHDLSQQLELHATGLRERLSEADLRQRDLLDTLDLYKKRWEGLISGPLFDRFTHWLQDILKYLDAHDGELQAIGKAWGKILDQVGEVAEKFVRNDWDGIKETFSSLAKLASAFAISIAKAANDIFSIMALRGVNKQVGLAEFFGLDADKELDHYQQRADIERKRQENIKNIDKLQTDTDKLIDDIASGKFKGTGSTTEHPNTPTGGPGGQNVTAQHFEAVKEMYRRDVEAAKTAEQEKINAVDRAEHQRTISVHDGEEERKASYVAEYKAIEDATENAINSVRGIAGLKKEQKDAFVKQLEDAREAAFRAMQKGTTGADDKIVDDQHAVQKANFDFEQKSALDHAKALLEIKKQYGQLGLATQQDVTDAEITVEEEEYQSRRATLEKEKDAAGQNDLDRTRATNAITLLDQGHTDSIEKNALRRREAREKDLETTLKLLEAEKQLAVTSLQSQINSAQHNGTLAPFQIQQLNKQLAQSQLESAGQALEDAQRRQDAESAGATAEKLQELEQSVEATRIAYDEAKANVDALSGSFKNFGRLFIGFDVGAAWKAATSGLGKVAVVAEATAGALNTIVGLVNTYRAGAAQGGVLGGIGAVGQQVGGLVGQVFPVAGAIISGIGAAFSLIGGIFTAAAKKMADQIKKEIDSIMNEYQLGHTTLIQTIQKLEQERLDAIARLSGKKGGQKELDQILPDLDKQIAELEKQADDIKKSFEANLLVMRQHGDVLQQWYKTWVDINKQVKDYLDAGGDSKQAQEFLALSLTQHRLDLQSQLNDGEQEAISDAIKLNDLLKQKNDLINQEKQAEFDILTKDSLERRQSTAVTTARQLANQRAQFQTQLDSLNQQIELTTSRLDKERQVFQISTDITALHRRDEELQLIALDAQLEKYRQMEQILGATNNFGFGGTFNPGSVPGITPTSVDVHINGPINAPDPKDFGRQIGQGIGDELDRRGRTGKRTF